MLQVGEEEAAEPVDDRRQHAAGTSGAHLPREHGREGPGEDEVEQDLPVEGDGEGEEGVEEQVERIERAQLAVREERVAETNVRAPEGKAALREAGRVEVPEGVVQVPEVRAEDLVREEEAGAGDHSRSEEREDSHRRHEE